MARGKSATTADRIVVGGIKFHAFQGLTKLERQVGVRCSIDVELTLDLKHAIDSDSLRDTIDYRKIHALVLDVGRKRKSYHLIESLGGIIADEILEGFPVAEVTVRVRKETPVLDGIVDYIGIEVTRRRGRIRGRGKGSR
jgi:7,8-dihydroneopterin aldolase/epimerase/oxygenase